MREEDKSLTDPETIEETSTSPEISNDEVVDSIALDDETPVVQSEALESPEDTTDPVQSPDDSADQLETAPIQGIESPLPPATPLVTETPVEPTKKSKKPLILALFVLLLIAAGVALYFTVLKKDSEQKGSSETAKVEEVQRLGVAPGVIEGTVEYSADGGKSWQKLDADVDLKEGNQVRTLTDGRVVLLIDDGSATRLSYSSSLELTSLDPSSIKITNLGGENYNRVVASSTREYAVISDKETYIAKGTAFRTINTDTKKGVEVFHSTVHVEQESSDVTEGSAFYSLCDQKEKEGTISGIDLTALKKDAFIKWNSEQDKKDAEFANALGVLVELDKPDPTPPTPTPTTTSTPNGITLTGSASEYSATFSWKVKGLDTSKGFKLVKSKSSQSPTYPENTAAYIEAGKTSYTLYLGDGRTYFFRLCAYRGDSCESYSNTVTITTPVKPKVAVTGDVKNLVISPTGAASWGMDGTAPNGFKVLGKKGGTPSFNDHDYKEFTTNQTHQISGLDSGEEYRFRVCKYDDGCVGYSNEVVYIAP